ncbi:MAG: hypothetical protein JXA22_10195, partial [Candidatus Thermoplasmatota archaeon]|nr:hypothetical protein [Candidatus Thermoplasmatota archaeon]
QSPSMDNFNFGNGLVRASYTNLKKYTRGKDIDPLKALSLERIRLDKIGGLRGQNPMAFFNYDYLQNRDLLPYFPTQPSNTKRYNTYDPRIGAFIIRDIATLPTIPEGVSKTGLDSGTSVDPGIVSVPVRGPGSVLRGGGG